MDNIDSQQTVTRIVEELKHEAAQRQRLLNSIARSDANGHRANSTQISPDIFEPPLNLEMPLGDKNQIQYRLQDLLAYDDRDFVHNAYRAILKRPPDPMGLTNALAGLRSGELSKIEMLLELLSSRESREKGVRVSGLRPIKLARALTRLPLVRYIANPVYGLLQWRLITSDQQRSMAAIFIRQDRLASSVNENVVVVLDAFRLLEEQKQTLNVVLERLAELTRYSEERLNEESMQRQQQFKDRTEELEDLRRVYNKYRTQVELTEKDLKRQMEHLLRKHQEVKTELVYQNQRLGFIERGAGSLSEVSHAGSESEAGGRSRRQEQEAGSHALDPFFASFDEHFRGDREDVKKRLRTYLPLVREHGAGSPEAPILDVACGRGEWLELLKEEHLHATGVDANVVLVNQCRERGLEVVQADLIEHLSGVSVGSLGAMSAFHIVEHLTVEDLIAFLDQALRVLHTDGLLLLETPNPENVLVGSCNFYLDPTHRNPLPPPVLKFLVESRGFVIVEIFGLNPSDEKPVAGESELARRFNQYFYGPMDYAIIARKV
jgi:SAM-dependent methyltransferase